MAEVMGYESALSLMTPVGVDPEILQSRQMAEGVTVGDLQRMAATVSSEATRQIIAKYGYSMSLTTEDAVFYPDGASSRRMPRITELSRIEFVHGTDVGHQLPVYWHGDGTAFTQMAMRGLRRTQILATIGLLVQGAVDAFGNAIETRLFTNTVNPIGTGGYDMPFVRGTSGLPSGAPQYTPPAFDGQAFAATHNHYLHNTSLPTLLNNMCAHLDHHGIRQPWDAVVSSSDLGDYRGLAGFVESVDSNINVIDTGGRTNAPTFYSSAELDTSDHGIYGRWKGDRGIVRLRISHRVPTNYVAMFKTYGELNMQNPIIVKYMPEFGGRATPFGVQPILKDSAFSNFPIEGIGMAFNFGPSAGNRLNGVVGRHAGSFANPTIS